MKAYQLSVPTKVFFGRDILEEVISEQKQLFKGTVLIVTTGRSLIRLGYLKNLKELVQGMPDVDRVIVYDKISANPKLDEVIKGTDFGKKEGAEFVIGFGGGSALDAAKAIAVGIGHEESLEEFFYGKKEPTGKTLPVAAIPTTAGTGSELSKAAIITDDLRKIKSGIRGVALYPKLAIVDSRFTETVPFNVTMETGFDVLAHAVESYISKAATPYTEMQSEYAIKIVGQYMPRLADNLQDREAREKMCFASMIMGINLGNASTCLPHRMQYPVGAHTDTSHGKGLAALFPAWMFYEYPYAGDKIGKIIHLLMGINCKDVTDVVESINRFIKGLGLSVSLNELGITEAVAGRLAGEVTGNILNDPAAQEDGIIGKIYKRAI